jgi:hypothetical protein
VRTPYKVDEIEPGGRDMMAEFRAGMDYIRHTQIIWLLILMAAVVGFFGFPFTQQFPALARDVLRVTGQTDANVAARNSALYAAQGVGALIAAIYLSLRSNNGRIGRLLLAGQMAFIIGLILISGIHWLLPVLVLVGFLGWGTVTQLTTMNTVIQLQVSDSLRGRVFSAYLWALQGVAPFGSLLVGWMAQNMGIPAAAFIAGTVCLLVIGVVHLRYPVIRNLAG